MELSPAQNELGAELLSRLEQNPIAQAECSPRQLRSPEFMRERLHVERIIGKLGPLRYEPAIPLLKRLHQLDDGIFNLLRSPGWALLKFDRPDVHEFLRNLLYGTFRQETFAVSSYVVLGGFDGLAPHLDTSKEECHNVIKETLSSLWSGMRWTGVGGSPRSLLLNDRRWIQFALRCRDHSEFAIGARSVLKNLFPDELKQALEEFKKPNPNEVEESLARLQAHPINLGYDQIESKQVGQEQSKRPKYDLEFLIERLAELRYEPAVPHLKKLYAEISDYKIKKDLGEALLEIGTPETHEFLQEFISDKDITRRSNAIKSIFLSDPLHAYERLIHYFTDEAFEDWIGIPATVLGKLSPHSDFHSPRKMLLDDPRWIELAIKLLEKRKLAFDCRVILHQLNWLERREALDRYQSNDRAFQIVSSGKGTFLSRYLQGEYTEVWRELTAIGPIVSESLRAEARSVAEETMTRVRINIELITKRLVETGYVFRASIEPDWDENSPWSPPAANVEETLNKIELLTGSPLPLSLRAFWSVVGNVNILGCREPKPPKSERWDMSEFDPLCIYTPESVLIQVELECLRKAEYRKETSPNYLSLSMDHYHKANYSGGEDYLMIAESGAMDEVLEFEGHGVFLIDYLRLSLKWGGFPRLERETLTPAQQAYLDQLREGLLEF